MHFLLHIWGDVEPHVFGPYKSEASRDRAAKRRCKADTSEGGFYKLRVIPRFDKGEIITGVEVAAFTGDELGRDA